MKRTLKRLMCAALAMTALVSCQKERFSEIVPSSGEKLEVSIAGSIGEFVPVDDTKATAESVVRVTWTKDDKVYVYDGSENLGTLTVKPDTKNASYALLSGTITASSLETAPEKLTLVYSKGADAAPTIKEGKVSIDLSAQSATDVPFVLYATIDYDTATLDKSDEYVPFSFATSVMTVNVTNLPTTTENAKIDITKAEIDEMSTVCELTISSNAEPTVAGTKKGVITRNAGFSQSDSRGVFTIAVAAEASAPSARKILVYQDTKVSGAPFATTKKLAANSSYNTVCQLSEYVFSRPDGMLSGVFTVADPDGIENSGDETKVQFSKGNLYAKKESEVWKWHFYDKQYEFLAADMAVSSPTMDMQPQRTVSSDETEIALFTWGYSDTTSFLPITSKCVRAHTTDGDLQLIYDKKYSEGGDDWGVAYCESNEMTVGTWRTLSNDEWKYLFENHNKKWITVCSIAGYAIAPDGVSADAIASSYTTENDWKTAQDAGIVFLPAAGKRGGSQVILVGSCGHYWASSVNGSQTGQAYRVIFYDTSVSNDYDGRAAGYSVRLVTESEGSYAPAVKVTGVSLASSKDTIEVKASKTLVATITPSNATHQEITWTSSDETVAKVDENGKVKGVAAGSAIITATTVDGNFSASSLVTVEKPIGPEYVTISGLKWAKMNLGANTINDFGDKYSWGEIETKEEYTQSNYSLKLDKSFSPDSGYDVARVKLGGNWRMPTKEEFISLDTACGGDGTNNQVLKTISDSCIENGKVKKGKYWLEEGQTVLSGIDELNDINVAGILFSDGENYLFLPAAGGGSGKYKGYYWASTLDENPNCAYCYAFSSTSSRPMDNTYPYYGCSIRPVSDIPAE